MVVSVFRPQKGASNQSQLVAVQFGHDRTVVRRRGKKGGRGFYTSPWLVLILILCQGEERGRGWGGEKKGEGVTWGEKGKKGEKLVKERRVEPKNIY